ncbi:branched chain amino acid ABC transporter substrate-binding protein (plasmid) [Paraburkholderia sp. PGU19]|uniref:branched-chain amino acid ABC transporter substrate-binding protein n=1 Tax=Paraburkholderia sp. PGU19 TaxID=2735434 RepID=UPI0015DAD137|nr:branched-chain amino acid ABC transporter substrate-binding protein [Paraburkholderia sp. PGU19]BCG04189.1 branched chain amino acid ABC transporter substrate-binding protein [Paraburkholderia sp. PGU19]
MKSFDTRNTALILLSIAFNIPSLADAQTTETVKIGAVAPLTGILAHIGRDVENGAKLAVDEANAKGLVINGKKITLQLVEEDDAADPRTATQVAQKLVDEKVVAVIGHVTSGTTIPASKIYRDGGITQITPSSTNPLYTQQGFKTTYRMIATDAQQAPALAAYAAKQMGAKTLAVVDDATAYGQGLADQFSKNAQTLGIKVISRDACTDKTVDFKGILTKIKNENPDIIMYGGEDAAGANLVRQASQLGLRSKILSGDGMCTEKLGELAGDASKNLTCSEASLPLEKMPGGREFKTKYESTFRQTMQPYAPFAYDAVNVIIDSMRRANSTDPAKILASMPSTSFNGVIGQIAFDQKGDLKDTGISIYQYKNGKKNLLEVMKL